MTKKQQEIFNMHVFSDTDMARIEFKQFKEPRGSLLGFVTIISKDIMSVEVPAFAWNKGDLYGGVVASKEDYYNVTQRAYDETGKEIKVRICVIEKECRKFINESIDELYNGENAPEEEAQAEAPKIPWKKK